MGSKSYYYWSRQRWFYNCSYLSLKPYVSELVMIDILKDKADGEIMDMAQGTGFRVSDFHDCW